MARAWLVAALLAPVIALALFRTMQLYRAFWLELGTVIGTTLNIALTEPGLWIHRTKEITPAENGGLNTGD